MSEVVSQTELAAQLGVSCAYVSQLKRRQWWPPGPPWDVDAVRRLLEENRQRPAKATRLSRRPESGTSPPARRQRRRRRRTGSSDPLDLLEAGQAGPIELADAAVSALARRLGERLRAGDERAQDVTGFRQALEELRKAKKDYLDLGVREGQLVALDAAAACAGEVAAHCVQAIEGLRSALASQVEVWLGDPAFVQLGAEERRRTVRAWASRQTRGCREVARSEVQELLR